MVSALLLLFEIAVVASDRHLMRMTHSAEGMEKAFQIAAAPVAAVA